MGCNLYNPFLNNCSHNINSNGSSDKDQIAQLRQESYIWVAANEFHLNDDPTKDVEEKHLKWYLSLTTNQKNLLTSITIQDHQEKEYKQQSQYIADEDIADKDIADEDIADRNIADKNIVGRNITDRDPIINICQNSISSFSSSRTSILTTPIVHSVNDDVNYIIYYIIKMFFIFQIKFNIFVYF